MKKFLLIFIFFVAVVSQLQAQNLNKYPVNVAKSAPAFIKFKDRIKTAEFSTPSAYDNYQIRVRNDDNTLIVQYNGSGDKPPDEGLSITEGNRSHFVIVTFLKDYDINKHAQLYYGLDDLKTLKNLAEEQKVMANANESEQKALVEKKQKAEAEERQKAFAAAEKDREEKEAQRKVALENEKKIQAKKEQEEKAVLAKAEKERIALEKEKAKIEKEKAAAIKKEKAIEVEKERIAKSKIDEAKKAQQEAEKQKALEDAQKERLAKEKREEETQAKLAAAQEEKARLETQKKANEEDKKYNIVGLWSRYGKNGIFVFEIPDKQRDWVNADFYLAKDTQFNYEMSQQMMTQADRKFDVQYGGDVKNKSNIEIADIQFKGPFTYYKIKINNPGAEDFLTGAVVAQVYDKDKAHKLELKTSYFTHIGMYPLVRPQTSQYAVLVTRTPVIENDDNIVLYVYERREKLGSAFAIIKGETLNKEMGKLEQSFSKSGKNTEGKGKKKKKK